MILPVSHGILDALVKAMQDHPEAKKIEVQGYASSEGGAQWNLQLSTARAASVLNYLKTHGVAAARLTSKGFGVANPIADNATEEGREKNRRVEFTIVETQ